MRSRNRFDIIVVGGGHAGIEASHIAAKMGYKVALITMLVENIGLPSCNPAIGGLGKGHLAKEIDALGGLMGLLADRSSIQSRILNASKGPAVRGTRAQIDMDLYRINAREALLATSNLEVIQSSVIDILLDDSGTKIRGITTNIGKTYFCDKLILTTGTFLNGLIHIGKTMSANGRFGEPSSTLSDVLKNLGLEVLRLKTGTCPRVNGKSINFDVLEEHFGDEIPPLFSHKSTHLPNPQLPCFITYTNEKTHKIINDNLKNSPLFSGQIAGIGPRYCPSIEDKINKFKDKDRHQLFLEPQTLSASEYYINGLSTSLPYEVQEEIIHSIKGLEDAQITRYGYAIEYDFINPKSLNHNLECKKIKGLFLGGQINGTTGYEEAAALGLMAGINASISLQNDRGETKFKNKQGAVLENLIFKRNEAYIGVMIDDLVTKGTNEPYRVFTSRAEFRLLLREDNTLYRLYKYARDIGTIGVDTYDCIDANFSAISFTSALFDDLYFTPNAKFLALLKALDLPAINDKMSANVVFGNEAVLENQNDLYAYKMHTIFDYLLEFAKNLEDTALKDRINKAYAMVFLNTKVDQNEVLKQLHIHAKYAHYIKEQNQNVKKYEELLNIKIPSDFVYSGLSGLSLEAIEKLEKNKPANLLEAQNISGITPAAIDVLCLHISLSQKRSKNA